MILLIDNYDSFTYNLYQQVGALGKDVQVVRNDALTIEQIDALAPEAIILSPGPGHPRDAGNTVAIIQQLHTKYPILGICLGHQAIGEAFGASVVRAENIVHGKMSNIAHSGTDLFVSLPEDVEIMRYHSLVIAEDTLPVEFVVQAKTTDDGEIMAIRHRDHLLFGLQFHPESIGTPDGSKMIENFLQAAAQKIVV
ncbi:anthranilate synthase component II [Caryophanon latum]|uniref:Aminodeoxychorismate/anthranilate synthase component II n=1 Tax=Caryophanon latum TaxID=33977 RepID=A0A1C0Z5R1_9BACL|nr:aminodeoxychorismate/anthranilate synthase component II [Caryophanon latum]OCS94590.1 aminodeoxychorismate/anthranilate synthase component II [Caryophanon latum]